MTNAATPRWYSYAEYQEVELASEIRHEFVEGVIRAMAGGTARHSALALALGSALRQAAITTGCLAHVEGRRLDVGGTDASPRRSYYPDVMVVCDSPQYAPSDRSPCFVAEVLSDSTAAIDQVEKLNAYAGIESVLAYAIVSQLEHRVTVHRRDGDVFHAEVYTAGQSFTLDCPAVAIEVDDLYAGL